MPRFSVYMSDPMYRQVHARWPDFNYSHALRIKIAELLSGEEEVPIYLCENCGRRVHWFGRAKRRRPVAPEYEGLPPETDGQRRQRAAGRRGSAKTPE